MVMTTKGGQLFQEK